ncbi:unnamed protein product [Cuscuta epithymum]|uniref:Uncharacterized protein n=1 Tax=Cuscuta epithymum TaxID=186058 RepID=A0AAV0E6M5_9ASTE|nr:unnamed protein product [Cuscuta epithymum]
MTQLYASRVPKISASQTEHFPSTLDDPPAMKLPTEAVFAFAFLSTLELLALEKLKIVFANLRFCFFKVLLSQNLKATKWCFLVLLGNVVNNSNFRDNVIPN